MNSEENIVKALKLYQVRLITQKKILIMRTNNLRLI